MPGIAPCKLLDTVRVLTDLNLSIQKGYISFDGCWFLDVFHVTDEHGHKILNPVLLSHIEHSIIVGEISSTEEGATSGMFPNPFRPLSLHPPP
ncbi:hypothetical protein ZIOFF_042358 [Zingiber officinale]|uniref:ACT domain-containing protein ACR n=1 Tax=Zingiber officinale TaxID=94328 RepID=A0A8J5FT35_ZINOF|nr:hypothetical protein ZIOFF_042358 [Zingiber officinale]